VYNGSRKAVINVSAKPVENTERVSVYIGKEQLEELKIKARERGLNVSSLIRMLIMEYLGNKK